MNRTKWFWAVIAAQALFLTAWAGYHEWVRQQAPTILLECRPVDPQDLLRGDYMTLRYLIGDPPAKADLGDGEVWVLLEPRGRHHVLVQASRERLVAGSGQLLVRGTVGRDWRSGQQATQISYGIERYFVPEGKGSPRFTAIEVEASVSPAHRLYIKRLLLDGAAYP